MLVFYVKIVGSNQLGGASLIIQFNIINSLVKVFDISVEFNNVVNSFVVGVVLLQSIIIGEDKDCEEDLEVMFDCYVCLK